MKNILLILSLFFCYTIVAQNEASNWYFGNNAGINFNTNTNAVSALTDGLLVTEEGCTSISDSDGNLLFYTNNRIDLFVIRIAQRYLNKYYYMGIFFSRLEPKIVYMPIILIKA